MRSKHSLLSALILLVLPILTGCMQGDTQPAEEVVGLPNPTPVYCEEQGYTLEMRFDESGGQYGGCQLLVDRVRVGTLITEPEPVTPKNLICSRTEPDHTSLNW